jgi:hypothetical protein
MTVLDRLYDRWPDEIDDLSRVSNGYERVLLTVQGGTLAVEGIRPIVSHRDRSITTTLAGLGVAAIGGTIVAAALTGRVTPAVRSLASASAVSMAVLDVTRGRGGVKGVLQAAAHLGLAAALRRAVVRRPAPVDPWA